MTKQPRYREIADHLRGRLAAGEFEVGSMLPGISDLQAQYDVPGLNTVRQAQGVLIEEGLLEPVHGRGTFVRALPSADDGPQSLRADLLNLQTALAGTQTALARVLRHLDDKQAGDGTD
jgi:DNA-binding GntR family transcriptional regulator